MINIIRDMPQIFRKKNQFMTLGLPVDHRGAAAVFFPALRFPVTVHGLSASQTHNEPKDK